MSYKGLRLAEPKTIDVAVTDRDLVPAEDEALVEIKRVSLCGSDYRLYDGTYSGPARYPLLFGHEWSGVVLDTGSEVLEVQEGDRVTGDCSKWCGHCEACLTDKNLCANIEKYGITIDGFSVQRALVPVQHLYRDPYYLPYDLLALTEMFAVALHAIKRLGNPPSEPPHRRTLIIGGGPLGIAVYLLLTLSYGWKRVDIHDLVGERIDFLKGLFPDRNIGHSIPSSEALNGGSYKDLYRSSPYAVVFEAAGYPEALRLAIDLALPRATIVTLGMPAQSSYDLSKVTSKALNVLGSIGGTGEFREVLDFFESHGPLVQRLVTRTYSYHDAHLAFEEGRDSRRNMKVQLNLSDEV